MDPKEYLKESSEHLLEKFNRFLIAEGIANTKYPFYIKKVQIALGELTKSGMVTANVSSAARKCAEWDSKLVERTHPVTKEKYWELVQWCKRYEGD
jgi:hypothetical protein